MKPHTLEHEDGLERCSWAGRDPQYIRYHDEEWGVRVVGDQQMFERLSLEGFQAGLSWLSILKRREGFRSSFKGFDLVAVANLTEAEVENMMLDSGIIRNRAKILSTISNARICLGLEAGISDLLWSFAPEESKKTLSVVQPGGFQWVATSLYSEAMAKELKRLGFGFVGSTTMHALMQATGMLNEHAPNCFRNPELT
jgi:DNA-3-methyladenine glycosylase I